MNKTQTKLETELGQNFSSNPSKCMIGNKQYIIYALDITSCKNNQNKLRLQKNRSVVKFEFLPDCTTLIVGFNQKHEFFGIYEAIHYSGLLPVSKSFWFDKNSADIAQHVRIFSQTVRNQSIHYISSKNIKQVLMRKKKWATHPTSYTRLKERIDKGSGKSALTTNPGDKTRATNYRACNFRFDVKLAYDDKCAILGKKVKNLQAAHIADVSSGYGNDTVKNGLLMNEVSHKKFDSGKLVILPDATYYLNPKNNRDIDLKGKRKKLHLPKQTQYHPEREFFIKKLEFLGFNIPGEIHEMC
jgi:predicted restriction endonuclease